MGDLKVAPLVDMQRADMAMAVIGVGEEPGARPDSWMPLEQRWSGTSRVVGWRAAAHDDVEAQLQQGRKNLATRMSARGVCLAAQLQDEAGRAGELGDEQERWESARRRGQEEDEVARLESMETWLSRVEADEHWSSRCRRAGRSRLRARRCGTGMERSEVKRRN
jgi:hypothetical protein